MTTGSWNSCQVFGEIYNNIAIFHNGRDKGQSGAVLCERVCLCEAEWPTSVFTLCLFITQHQSKQNDVEHCSKVNSQYSKWKHLSVTTCPAKTYQFCFAVVFISDKIQYDFYALDTYYTAGWASNMQGRGACTQQILQATLTGLQSSTCIHLSLLMHLPSATVAHCHSDKEMSKASYTAARKC